MTRIRTYFALCALALVVPVLIAGCGGDDSSDVDPQTVLDETFDNDESVSSGNLSLSVGGSAEGDQGGSFEASLSGPFQGDPDDPTAIPQLDWTGSLTAEGAGQSVNFEGGITVTEDNAYVEYAGNAYEVGAQTFGEFKKLAEQASAQQTETEGLSFSEAFTQGCEQSLQAQGGDTAACQIDFESWLGDLTDEGEEEIEGAETVHIGGSLDVEAMLGDLIELGSAVPQASAAGVPSEEQVQQVADAISEASFDLYSGVDDRVLRGLDFNLAVDPSAIPEASAAGVESIDANFSMRLAGVNEEQEISAPSDAQPIDELLGQFGVDPGSHGGLGALGGAGAGLPGGGGGGG
ncbi:MAG: hypothetical protein ACRDLO_02090, partial [Solirubrobacterales bacterium]